MKKAIVTGATGFIGSVLVRKLLQENVEVLALGRKPQENIDSDRSALLSGAWYLQIDMCDIQSLPARAKEIGWYSGDSCVFYNLAWGGRINLSDLDVEAQLRNVDWADKAIRAAKMLGCSTFIHSGTMEEAFTAEYLDLDFHDENKYNRHVIYSVSKMISKNIIKLASRRENIKVIFAKNSHVMGPNDNKDSFLQVTLQKLISGDELIFSEGNQIFDVISVNDCAVAYVLVGQKGKHGCDYWIGSGHPRRLREYVEIMASMYNSGQPLQFGKLPYNDIALTQEDFSIEAIFRDTGFQPVQTYEDTVKELYNWLMKVAKA